MERANCKRNPYIVSGIRKLQMDFANCKRNRQILSGIRKSLRNQLTICKFHCFSLQVFVRGSHRNVVGGIRLHFGTCLKVSLWNPGTYRHKIVRLCSAQFDLVMISICFSKRSGSSYYTFVLYTDLLSSPLNFLNFRQ